MANAILIVDVQNDFCEGGALATEDGATVAAGITEHLLSWDYDLVVASRDWHSREGDNGGHFSGSPDFVDTWPTHCVAWSAGAGYHPNLDYSLIDEHIYKGMGSPDYSAFQGTLPNNAATLHEALESEGVTDLTIVGIATDHCVKASALDAVELGYKVRVLTSLTAAVSPEGRETAIEEMRAAGVEIVS